MGGVRLPEYDDLDATAMGALVRAGEVSPAELLQAAIERIEARNPPLNAVIRPLFDAAHAEVARGLPEGPLTGVPMLVKDLMADIAGVPTTSGSRLLEHYVPAVDAEIVRRWRNAGLVIVGKTNTPELGLVGVTEPALHGPTHNPWHTAHTPGGSSGGSGAAVAARMVAIAGAGDGGGSIRIPAACCGLVGLKPTRGRTPNGPLVFEGWSGLTVQHVLARSMRDTALLLDVASGVELGAPYCAPHVPGTFAAEVDEAPGRLRIAFSTGTIFGGANHRECVLAVERAAELCRSLGHEVDEAAPELDRPRLARAWIGIVAANLAAEIARAEIVVGRSAARDDLEPLTALVREIGRKGQSGADFVAHQFAAQKAGHAVAQFHERYDVWITSTLGRPPARIGEFAMPPVRRVLSSIARAVPTKRSMGIALEMMANDPQLHAYPNTQLANLTGQPGLSLPLHTSGDGLPVGVQFMARYGDEATLLRLGAQLERAVPWARKKPVVAGLQRT
jgi:amidase